MTTAIKLAWDGDKCTGAAADGKSASIVYEPDPRLDPIDTTSAMHARSLTERAEIELRVRGLLGG